MPPALQLPYVRGPAERAGGRAFVKKILPVADVEHPRHGTLSFTRERLRRLVDRFKAGAYDMVPFVVADGPGHAGGDDPERVRGTVRDLELTDDGLFARIEASERGARLIADNPDLPVSVRLVRLPGGEALAHVLATLDPVARGMGPWTPVELSSARLNVIDLSNGSFAARRELVVLDEMGEPVELSGAERAESERIVWRDGLPYGPPIELSATERDEAQELAGLLAAWEKQEGPI